MSGVGTLEVAGIIKVDDATQTLLNQIFVVNIKGPCHIDSEFL